jgi:hypothetical protein
MMSLFDRIFLINDVAPSQLVVKRKRPLRDQRLQIIVRQPISECGLAEEEQNVLFDAHIVYS